MTGYFITVFTTPLKSVSDQIFPFVFFLFLIIYAIVGS